MEERFLPAVLPSSADLISLLRLHTAVFNHNGSTLRDPLDVHGCLEQLGLAFKEISRREIK